MNRDPLITLVHTKRLGYCRKGVRKFFIRYGLDYRKFLNEGIRASEILAATNHNQLAIAAAEVANERK